jgi:hypothetical protein
MRELSRPLPRLYQTSGVTMYATYDDKAATTSLPRRKSFEPSMNTDRIIHTIKEFVLLHSAHMGMWLVSASG